MGPGGGRIATEEAGPAGRNFKMRPHNITVMAIFEIGFGGIAGSF
jgi:hypothetical protein